MRVVATVRTGYRQPSQQLPRQWDVDDGLRTRQRGPHTRAVHDGALSLSQPLHPTAKPQDMQAGQVRSGLGGDRREGLRIGRAYSADPSLRHLRLPLLCLVRRRGGGRSCRIAVPMNQLDLPNLIYQMKKKILQPLLT